MEEITLEEYTYLNNHSFSHFFLIALFMTTRVNDNDDDCRC
jgi:hypothetical protein